MSFSFLVGLASKSLTVHATYVTPSRRMHNCSRNENPNMPLVLCLEDALDELQRGGQVLLERRLNLLRRQDEPAGLRRVGP